MNKVFCDRCGRECVEGSAYYTIDIYGFDINPTNDGRVSLDAATQNIATNSNKVFGKERHYCKKCKDEIAQFMCGNITPETSAFDPTKIQEVIERRRNRNI